MSYEGLLRFLAKSQIKAINQGTGLGGGTIEITTFDDVSIGVAVQKEFVIE